MMDLMVSHDLSYRLSEIIVEKSVEVPRVLD
jgi:hypothetical protein